MLSIGTAMARRCKAERSPTRQSRYGDGARSAWAEGSSALRVCAALPRYQIEAPADFDLFRIRSLQTEPRG
jgi:hypothetical protein